MYIVFQIEQEPLRLSDYDSLVEYITSITSSNPDIFLGYIKRYGYSSFDLDNIIIIDLNNYQYFCGKYYNSSGTLIKTVNGYISRYERNKKLTAICT